jgi:hypothetical protein
MGWGLILALVLSILAAAVIYHLARKIMPLVYHGVLGFLVFALFNYLGILKVPLDIWTFLIAAIGGVVGVVIVLALSFLGVPL